tara:strand:- start:377 stop:520 length:144 start_codon:yes stop_codon:yes gene_type:complete
MGLIPKFPRKKRESQYRLGINKRRNMIGLNLVTKLVDSAINNNFKKI